MRVRFATLFPPFLKKWYKKTAVKILIFYNREQQKYLILDKIIQEKLYQIQRKRSTIFNKKGKEKKERVRENFPKKCSEQTIGCE